jgi:hypothetical protein
MHPAEHLCEIGDRTPVQQPLHRQQHNVEFCPVSIALVTQRIAEDVFISRARARIHRIRFCCAFRRLHRHTGPESLNVELDDYLIP